MANLYEEGKIYIGKHRDNKENRVIASLSLGAERTFILTHDPPKTARTEPSTTTEKKRKSTTLSEIQPYRCTLSNGSLLVMQGATQQHWKHEIPKERGVTTGRISLTFRQLVF